MPRSHILGFTLLATTAACGEQGKTPATSFDATADGAGSVDAGKAEDGSVGTSGHAGTGSPSPDDSDDSDDSTPSGGEADSDDGSIPSDSTADSSSSGVKFDFAGGDDVMTAGDSGTEEGCEKVDFLFVIDNSSSMEPHQTALIDSFGPFVDTIYDALPAQDFRIMAIDSDAGQDIYETCEPCMPDSYWCGDWCTAKTGLDVACETTLGAGEVAPYNNKASNTICGVPDGKRYLTSALSRPEIKDKFACIAKTGTFGSWAELPMTAMADAVTTQNQPGGCNEGFVRDDAVLVVTIITNDIPTCVSDNASLVGGPQDWFNAVVAAKRGLANNVVMAAIIATEASTCIGNTDGCAQGLPAQRFLDFVAMFGIRGVTGDVCDSNYDAFFERAVGLIETACREFTPPPE